MLISKQWLDEFIVRGNKLSAEKVAAELKLKTVEVEGIKNQGKDLAGIVVGKIITVAKHPDADKLKICQVDVGKEKLQVVCGGSNIREGMMVAMGRIGAKVKWHGQGDLVELKPVKIRGVESFGMICASDEIGLGEMFPKKEEREIVDLSHFKVKPGTALAEALGLTDVVFDIDNKSLSHRPDLWGHYGIAREVAAIFGKKLQSYAPPKVTGGKEVRLKVEVKDKKLCPRYMGVVVGNIAIAPSPEWMQARLRAVGIRPINNIVDITNYVMFEIGQPLHAFDARQVTPNSELRTPKSIVVRRAKGGEKFTTLDGKTHNLTSEMLLIADTEKPLAIAGVMGGQNSEISSDTNTIIFESATFDASSVRKTSTALGIRTDSSARFEKGLDPELPPYALARAVQLTQQLCPGARVASQIADVKNFTSRPRSISMPWDAFSRVIGVDIPKAQITKILKGLGFGVKTNAKGLTVTVPSWRAGKDVSIPEDIVEEVLRIYGFDRVSTALPSFPITPAPANGLRNLERRVKDILALEEGYTEVYNYSFESGEWLKRIGDSVAEHLELDNPIAKDRPYLRRSLIPNLLANMEANAHRYSQVHLFEIGRVFRAEEGGEDSGDKNTARLPAQPVKLAVVTGGKAAATPFFSVSAALRTLAKRLGFSYTLTKQAVHEGDVVHPGRFAEVMVAGALVGRIAELHPRVQERLGIPYRVGMLEINLETLLPLLKQKSSYRPVAQFPEVVRDVAFVLNKKYSHREVQSALAHVDPLIVDVELFDVFSGGNVPAGKKSMAYHVCYQSPTRTLIAGEVDAAHAKIQKLLQEKFGAEVRK